MRLSFLIQVVALAVVLGAIPSPASAQTRIDSYGHLIGDDEAARLNAFSETLHQRPTLRGYLVGYAEATIPAGVLLRRLYGDQRYLIESCGLEPDRVVVVNGGYRPIFTIELWLVPDNTVPPVMATSTIDTSKRYLFDEVCYGCEEPLTLDLDGLREGLKFFASVMQKAPNSGGSIVIRPGFNFGSRAALRKARLAKGLLVREYNVASRRVTISLAPRRKHNVAMAELWVLPAAPNP